MSRAAAGVVSALSRGWWLVVGTPVATVVLALAFVFMVTPEFETTTSLRIVEEEGPLGGTLPGSAQAVGGLSALASLTGQGVPLQTEMAVLAGRGRSEELVEEMGLRLEVRRPARTPRSEIVESVRLPLDGPEGELDLRRRADGSFHVTGRLLASRDPFRIVGGRRFEERDLGSAAPGERLPLQGAEIVLAQGAAAHERITLRLLPRDQALKKLADRLSVTRPQRDADVIQVSLRWGDPFLAADAANRLVADYLAYREEMRVGAASRSSAFLAEQLDSLGTELRAAEEGLRRYREARGVVAPEAQVSAEVTRLAELKGRRDLLQAERAALADLLAELTTGGASVSEQRRVVFFPTLLQSQSTAELLRLLNALETERATLLARRTSGAREVGLITGRIEELERELRTVAQTYLQGLGDQVAALDRTLDGSEAALDRVPAVEMEYVRFRRRVELLTEVTLFLETRLKEAELNAASEGVGAHVLSRARPPQEPVTPRPALTVALALLVGLVLGGAGAVALDRTAGPASG